MPSKKFVQEMPIDHQRPVPGPKSSKDYLTPDGREKPSSVPIAPPIGYIKQPSLSERIRDMVRSEHLRLAAVQAGVETFEEADDFNVGDDFDPTSPYEEQFDQVIETTGPPQAAPTAPQAPLATPPRDNVPASTEPPSEPLPDNTPGGGTAGGGFTEPAPPPQARLAPSCGAKNNPVRYLIRTGLGDRRPGQNGT